MEKNVSLFPAPGPLLSGRLHVVIKEEFVGMRAQAQGIMLLAFGGDPHIQEVLGKDISFEEEGMVPFEEIQRLAEAAGDVRDFFQLFGRQLVDVLVERFAWVDFVLDAIQARQQHGGKGDIGIGGWIRRAILDAFALWVFAIGRDTNGGPSGCASCRPG